MIRRYGRDADALGVPALFFGPLLRFAAAGDEGTRGSMGPDNLRGRG